MRMLGLLAQFESLRRRRLEEHHSERRQAEGEVKRAPGMSLGDRPDAPRVARVRPTIDLGVRVENLPVKATLRHADAVILTHDWREITDDHHQLAGRPPAPEERQDAVLPVVKLEPLEAGPLEIHLVQGRVRTEQRVQVANKPLHALMRSPLQEVPVEALVVLPLTPLGELPAHEEQFLSRMPPHVAEQEPEIRITLPEVTGHLIQQ